MDEATWSELKSLRWRANIALLLAALACGWAVYVTAVPMRSISSERIVTRELLLVDSAGRAWGELSMGGEVSGLKLEMGADQLVGLGFTSTGGPSLSMYGRVGGATIDLADDDLSLKLSRQGGAAFEVDVTGSFPRVRATDADGASSWVRAPR